jgi:hypothetical protein
MRRGTEDTSIGGGTFWKVEREAGYGGKEGLY